MFGCLAQILKSKSKILRAKYAKHHHAKVLDLIYLFLRSLLHIRAGVIPFRCSNTKALVSRTLNTEQVTTAKGWPTSMKIIIALAQSGIVAIKMPQEAKGI